LYRCHIVVPTDERNVNERNVMNVILTFVAKMVVLEHKDLPEYEDPLVHKVLLEYKDLQAYKVLQEYKELMDQHQIQVLLVLLE
jgi:hypothetical protein